MQRAEAWRSGIELRRAGWLEERLLYSHSAEQGQCEGIGLLRATAVVDSTLVFVVYSMQHHERAKVSQVIKIVT